MGNDEHQQNTEPDIIIIDDYSDVYSEDDDIYDSLAFWGNGDDGEEQYQQNTEPEYIIIDDDNDDDND